MPSARFAQLQEQLAHLHKVFIPRGRKGRLLSLSPRLSTRALAYRVLSHAEIEHYLEDRVLEVALAADAAWKSQRRVSEVTLCLMAFCGASMSKPPSTFKAPSEKSQKDWHEQVRPDDRVLKSVSAHVRKVTRENHGI